MDKVGLEVMGLCKSIKKQPIVEDISFRITSGQVLALCGGNGAGKSTVLRMIAGILRPTSGEVAVNNVRWLKERKRYSEQIGYMPDDYQFNQGLSAEEMLLFWASLRKVPKERVQEVLTMVGLEDQRKTGLRPSPKACANVCYSPRLCCRNLHCSSWMSQQMDWTHSGCRN